jgi:antiviral helicase SKI2
MLKRKEQVDKSSGVSANARGGRGGRGGAMTRGGSRPMTRSYQSSMQTVSTLHFYPIYSTLMPFSRTATCLSI